MMFVVLVLVTDREEKEQAGKRNFEAFAVGRPVAVM
jgi:hypothetical protein